MRAADRVHCSNAVTPCVPPTAGRPAPYERGARFVLCPEQRVTCSDSFPSAVVWLATLCATLAAARVQQRCYSLSVTISLSFDPCEQGAPARSALLASGVSHAVTASRLPLCGGPRQALMWCVCHHQPDALLHASRARFALCPRLVTRRDRLAPAVRTVIMMSLAAPSATLAADRVHSR